MIEKFRALVADRHNYAKTWKEKTGGKVIGYFCTYFPEEMAYAAGFLPVRVLGSKELQNITQQYVHGIYCPFSHQILAEGLKGNYSYLDGIVLAQSCLHASQAFSSWQLHVPTPHSYVYYMPKKVQSSRAKPFLVEELATFKGILEAWRGKPLSQEALDEAINLCNINRRLLKQIYETRRAVNPPIGGAEAMAMTLSSMLSDKREHNQLLSHAFEELTSRQTGTPDVRLMILGSENDDIDFIEMVEALGAMVVIDDHCTGSRYFWNEIVPEENRLAAIATRYLDRPPCPERDWEARRRWEHVLRLAREYNIQGVLLIQQKFCDSHESHMPFLKSLFEKNDIPSLFLEFHVTVPAAQFRTRIEAFLEMLRPD